MNVSFLAADEIQAQKLSSLGEWHSQKEDDEEGLYSTRMPAHNQIKAKFSTES